MGLPLGLFGLVLLLLRCGHLLGPLLNHLPSVFQRRHPLFPPCQFCWYIQRLLGFLGLRLRGPLHQFLHFQFQLLDHFPGPTVAHGRMLAGVGLDFGPIHAHRTHFGQAQLLGQLQDADKGRTKCAPIEHPELANRRMIRMEIGAQITNRHIAVGRCFDRPGAKPTGRVTVDQQSRHHRGRILLAAGAAVIDLEVVGWDLIDGIQNEMNDMAFGHPLAQVAGQQHRCLSVQIDETCSHGDLIPAHPPLFKLFQNIFDS